MAFIICNACNHSHSPTLLNVTLYNFCPLSLSIIFSYMSLLIIFFIITRVSGQKVPLAPFDFSKVLCVNSLRYLQERL